MKSSSLHSSDEGDFTNKCLDELPLRKEKQSKASQNGVSGNPQSSSEPTVSMVTAMENFTISSYSLIKLCNLNSVSLYSTYYGQKSSQNLENIKQYRFHNQPERKCKVEGHFTEQQTETQKRFSCLVIATLMTKS